MSAAKHRPVVALHGFLGCAADWDELFRDLGTDRRCIAFDLPGHGAAPPPHDDGLQRVAESIVEATDGLGEVDFVGYSMGGRMLYQLADDPRLQPWRRMVLVGAHPGLREDGERDNRRVSDRWLAERIAGSDFEAFLDAWYEAPLFGSLRRAAGYRAMLERRMSGEPRHLAAALRTLGVAELPSTWEHLADIPGEVLLVAGAKDDKYRVVNEAAAEAIPSAKTAVIPNAAHAPHVEQPEAFAAVVREFLDAPTPRAGS